MCVCIYICVCVCDEYELQFITSVGKLSKPENQLLATLVWGSVGADTGIYLGCGAFQESPVKSL